MKTFVASIMTAFALTVVGCVTASKTGDAPVAEEICPTCKTKLVASAINEKGRPTGYTPVHACPECKGSVVAVKKGDKWVHTAKDGADHSNCKTCNPK